jgi:hypothetical protein
MTIEKESFCKFSGCLTIYKEPNTEDFEDLQIIGIIPNINEEIDCNNDIYNVIKKSELYAQLKMGTYHVYFYGHIKYWLESHGENGSEWDSSVCLDDDLSFFTLFEYPSDNQIWE